MKEQKLVQIIKKYGRDSLSLDVEALDIKWTFWNDNDTPNEDNGYTHQVESLELRGDRVYVIWDDRTDDSFESLDIEEELPWGTYNCAENIYDEVTSYVEDGYWDE